MTNDITTIYSKIIEAEGRHTKFLNATEKNLSYFFFGKSIPIMKRDVFPEVDILTAVSSYSPEAYNPLSYLITAFIDEIANSSFRTTVTPFPVAGREPYESFADNLENYLIEIHRQSKRKKNLRGLAFLLITQGYFGIYTDGFKYWFLTPYDLIPGDPAISDIQDQPMMIRKTKARKSYLSSIPNLDINKEQVSAFSLTPDLEYISLYDVWIKDLDLNICLTQGGQLVYSQPFRYPKRYPFFGAIDTELLNSFYPIPLMQKLTALLPKYQESQSSTEESSKSIAKPLLVYDADSGIDIDMVRRALKEGYKHIIIGKNREGEINFKAPGNLPGYAVGQSREIVEEMMKHLGLTSMFLGTPTAGVRERGALTKLIKAAFRKLASKATLIEEAFSELDEYLLDYLKTHKLKATDKFNFSNIEEIFSGGIHYIPQEKFPEFATEDTYEAKMFVLSKWRAKLISQEGALIELGHAQPKKVLDQVRSEMKDQQKFALELKEIAEQGKHQSIFDQIWNRLKGKLSNRFDLTPVADDKILVKCAEEEKEKVSFLLSDISEYVLIEIYKNKEAVPPEQKELKIEAPEPTPVPQAQETSPEVRGTPIEPSEQGMETRGRPSAKPPVPEAQEKAIAKSEEKSEVIEISPSLGFSEEYLQELIRASKTIRPSQVNKYINLPGFYIEGPHAKWIYTGKKILIIKARMFENLLDQPYLLCGFDKVFGIIIVRRIIKDFDFKALQKFHLVSDRERKKWWKENELYLYMFEFHPFELPLDYEREKGVQTFIKQVRIKKESLGLPYRGDLKPISLTPWKIPQPHKPEKKSFQPHEVFSLDRLKEIIPESIYDVSFKVDGLRAFLWVADGKAKIFSDIGSQWNDLRVKPILDEAIKLFKHNVLLDGELIMEGIRRKDVTGYIQGKWEPTSEQLKSLRFICWDILYVKDRSIASLPFSKRSAVLDLYLPYKTTQKGKIQRVIHGVAKDRAGVITLAKKYMSNEGVVIRDVNASYWATHSTYKMKQMFDVDAKVFAQANTKFGLPIYFCELRDGTYIGSTYAQSEVKAKNGEVIRVNINHVSILPTGAVNWYGPRPQSWKQKITPKKTSLTQVGIGGADTLDLIKEIYLVTGGTKEKWEAWLPKHLEWKKTEMSELKDKIIKKVKEGIEVTKIL